MNLSYQNEIDKARFQHDIAYGCFTDSPKRTAADKILHDKAFNVAKIRNFMDITVDLFQWLIHFLIKKFLLEQLKMKLC